MDSLRSNSIYKSLHRVSSDFASLDSAYVCATFNPADLGDGDLHRIEGLLFFLVEEGSLELEINSESSKFVSGSFAALSYGTNVRVISPSGADNKVSSLFFYKDFLQGVNINFAAISTPVIIDRTSPGMVLSGREYDIVKRYIDLLRLNCLSGINSQIENSVAASLLAALIYQLVDFIYQRLGKHTSVKGQRACRTAYVHDFIKLVHVYYTQERSVSFYASKLFISPKYLSMLVKEATGKSAARWIDEFVLMEAKNLLRFSGKNVQQVAYSLNFSNQSAFGKYFKHLTGMSPTEYQKS